jgi:hypothetical protein
MNQFSSGISGKLIVGVVLLFLLSLLAPSLWRHWTASDETTTAQAARPTSYRDTRGWTTTYQSHYDAYQAAKTASAIASSTSREVKPASPPVVAEVATRPTHTASLAELEAPGEVAAIGPVVAEQIDLDPSITETPALPAPRPGIDDDSYPEPQQPPLALPEDAPLPKVVQPSEPPATEGQWPHPSGLITQLELLAKEDPAAAAWSAQVIETIDRLTTVPTLADPAAEPLLAELKSLADQVRQMALQIEDEDRRSALLRAGYAIIRRHSIWEPAHKLAMREQTRHPIPTPAQWKSSLAEVYARLTTTDQSHTRWREYLLLDRAGTQFGNSGVPAEQQRELAREILHRLTSAHLSHSQFQFLNAPPFDQFATYLRLWADQPRDYAELLSTLEAYEHLELDEQSTRLADMYQQFRWSPDVEIEELAETVNAYYRNANVRVAVSAELVNRLLPRSAYTKEPVRDTIQGAYVEGSSATSTQLRLVLLPDADSWRLGLEARGAVTSVTASSKGPATFYQDGVSYYRARKLLTVDRRGVRMFSAEAHADANSQMTDFETDFDGVPFLGGIVRNIARKQYDDTQYAAKQEVEGKIVDRASSQLDREVALKLQEGQRNFQLKLLDPLRQLKLEPTAVSMETTLERLIARYRLAGRDQVGAHTPRPQAPGDSLLSVQVHESALNNVIDHLELQGRRYELRELYKIVTSRFSQDQSLTPPEDLPEDVYVTFADEDPVRVDCEDGRVLLSIRLKELSHGERSKWNNFMIRAYYAPDSDQLDANLVRDGVIELGGERLRFGDQVALRGIFSRVLSRNRKLSLVNQQIAKAPSLRDQQVTQFVIHDGWIGVALGPKYADRTTTMTPVPVKAKKVR